MLDQLYFFSLNWWLLLAGTILFFVAATEIGFRLGRRRAGDEEQQSLAGTLVTALLALLGLLLAFSFNTAETRFETRKQLVLEEANAISTTYLRTDMLPEARAQRARELLRQYIEVRLGAREPENFDDMLSRSAEIHSRLWRVVSDHSAEHPEQVSAGLLVHSLNRVIDLHAQRVNVIMYHRLPVAILVTLYVVGALSMAVLGYDSGLTRKRALLPSTALVLAFSIVVLLIIDLDRPYQRLFRVNQQALVDVSQQMVAREQERGDLSSDEVPTPPLQPPQEQSDD